MKNIKEFVTNWALIPLLVIFSILSFICGIFYATYENRCTYDSYLAQYNPPYMLGCWLLEDRSNESKYAKLAESYIDVIGQICERKMGSENFAIEWKPMDCPLSDANDDRVSCFEISCGEDNFKWER